MDLKQQLADYAAVQQFVNRHADEDQELEFKGQPYRHSAHPPDKKAEQRRELARDVTSFANAEGGTLLIGVVQDANGYASTLEPFDDLQGHEDFVAGVLAQLVQPRLDILTIRRHAVGGAGDRGIIAVHVGQAEAGKPHAVLNGNELEFWVRVGKSKQPMSYEQLEQRFNGGADAALRRQVDAITVNDVLRLEWRLERAGWNWPLIEQLLEELSPYCREERFGDAVRRRLLHAIDRAIDNAKFGLPLSTMALIVQHVRELLPISSLVGRSWRASTPDELEMLRFARRMAFDLMYVASRYLRNAGIINSAGTIVHAILRFAALNEITELKQHCISQLNERIEWARKDGLESAARLLERECPKDG